MSYRRRARALKKRYGHGFPRGRGPSKADKKAAWMRSFRDEAAALGAHPGQIDWATAEYLFSQGIDPVEAARKKYLKA